MNLWDQAKDHYGWLVSAAAAAAGFLARRSSDRPIRERLTASWIGRRLAVEKDNANLRADLLGMQESIVRREANWNAEREERDRYIETLMARIDRLTRVAEEIKTAHDNGSLIASGPPSNEPTAPPATSSPSSRKSRP